MDRKEVAIEHKWNLEDLFESLDEWKGCGEELKQKVENIKVYQPDLTSSAQRLCEGLDEILETKKLLLKWYVYAHGLSDEDVSKSAPLGMVQECMQMMNDLSSATSFIRPALLKLSEETIGNYIDQEKGLEKYRQYFDNVMRGKAHVLSDEEEYILANTGLIKGAGHDVFNVFTNAEFPWPSTTLSTGQEIELTQANFGLYRTTDVREDRKLVFETFFGALNKFKQTLGTQLYSHLKESVFNKKIRKYDSCLHAALHANNIPTEVYHSLISNIEDGLPVLYRSIELRKKMLGIDHLEYYDLYANLIPAMKDEYTYDQARQLTLDSLKVMGEEYMKVATEAFDSRWIDVYPTKGKRSGAYSNGAAYDVHPYILLNFKGKYNDVSTLTHELGHTMHSYFSNTYQPYVNANYPIFLAEIASTVNENLLIDHVLKQTDDKRTRLSLLGSQLEGFRTTLFRQVQFAEFELKIHELAEQGKPLTGDTFSDIYIKLLKKYHGHDQGVVNISDSQAIEWAYVPHFYYNFYVYQYSTSFTVSQVVSEKILTEGQPFVDEYIKFLSSGCAVYPMEAISKMGIDMLSKMPFEMTMKKMNAIIDEIEGLI